MPATNHDLQGMGSKPRMEMLAEAARALDNGRTVIAPADTGYVVCAGAGCAAVLAPAGPAAWIAPDAGAMIAAIPLSGVHAKVVRTLGPGPAVFAVHLDEAGVLRVLERLGFPPGVVDSGGAIRVRLASESLAALIAAGAKEAVCCWEPVDGSGRSLPSAQEASSAAEALGITPTTVIAESSPTKGGARARPTVIALERTGGVRVLSEGAYETRYVMKQSSLNILFVCTGNTCRSPMAEAIAATLVARKSKLGAPAVHVGSAGVGAGNGSPRTPEGGRALKERGYEPAKGSSRPLTRQLIAEADVIYTMTRSHLEGVLALDPSAKGKVHTLDPSGVDVNDPIGLSQDAYNDVAGRLEALIQQRLKEWMP